MAKYHDDLVRKVDQQTQNYYQGETIQAIDIIHDFNLNFNRGNIIKYAIRAGKKTQGVKGAIEDLNKVIDSARFEIARLTNQIDF